MSDGGGADALLKGMLGIGLSGNKGEAAAPKKSDGAPAQAPSGGSKGATQEGKGGKKKPRSRGGQRRGSAGQSEGDDAGDDVVVVASKNDNAAAQPQKKGGKKKPKKKPSTNETKTPPPANKKQAATDKLKKSKEKFHSSEHNANNYAWSAFQSSPDPSALPDVGGLFGDDDRAAGGKEDRNEKNSDGDGDEVLDPSDGIRTSLVRSMMAKTEPTPTKGGGGERADAGTALLQRLQSPASSNQNSPAVAPMSEEGIDKRFRTLESVEGEMTKPTDGGATKPSAAAEGKGGSREATNEPQKGGGQYQEPDPITQLLNPGLHPGGYGVPQHPQQHMGYHQPMNYPPQPHHPMHHPMHPPYPPYPPYGAMPQHHHHPMHPPQMQQYPNYPPPPGGMPGIYPGPPAHYPGGGYYYGQQHPPQQHPPPMGGYYPGPAGNTPQQPQQYTQQQRPQRPPPPEPKPDNSWAGRVKKAAAASPPKAEAPAAGNGGGAPSTAGAGGAQAGPKGGTAAGTAKSREGTPAKKSPGARKQPSPQKGGKK